MAEAALPAVMRVLIGKARSQLEARVINDAGLKRGRKRSTFCPFCKRSS